MRESFEQNIREYTETINDSLLDLSKEGKKVSEVHKVQTVEYGAYNAGTSIEAEQEIYKIQKAKIEQLKKFKRFLQATRSGGSGFVHPEIRKDVPIISFREGSGFVVTDQTGVSQSITLGEIMTDYEWGLEYTFDSSVNIHDIRKYYFSKLKAGLSDKLDEQIIISELAYEDGDDLKKVAYRSIQDTETDTEKQGVIAERMVKSFLKRLSIDTDADFEILDASVYQDVEQKIDFIIHRKSKPHERGVHVTESSRVDVGIQFTTAFSKTDKKERQIRRSKRNLEEVDDLVLVAIPAYDASVLYRKWKEHKTSGGPHKRWGKTIQETIFRGVMDKVLTKEEIDRFCQNHLK